MKFSTSSTMFWLKRISGILASLLIVTVVVGSVLPSQVHVERKLTINARPQQIYPLIANFKQWNKWSPWAKIDPNAEFKIVGRGLKQKMFWSSEDPRVGKGSQEFITANKPTHIKTHLDFGKQEIADASFDLIAENNATEVTWSLDTDMRAGVPIYMKPFGAYLGFFMDSIVGKDYEQGLDNLQKLVQN
ncbi:MAG: SRPBCC family protein [Cyanobacteria bacterium P01_G01_bin.67]